MKRIELKVFRIRQQLTQSQMAEKLGISLSHYCGLEGGQQDPSYKVMTRFGEIFGVSPEETGRIFRKAEQASKEQ